MALEEPKEEDFSSSLAISQSPLTAKKCFPTYRGKLLCFSACPWHGLWS